MKKFSHKAFQKLSLGLGLLSLSFIAHAMPDLMNAYQSALSNDPTFKQACHTYLSARESWPQALSSLLPLVSGTGSWSDIHTITESGNPFLSGVNETHYRQRDYTLSASQPIFNYSAWAKLQQSGNAVKQALAIYDDASQNLMFRTATAYFNVLKAKDNLKYTKAQKVANAQSLTQAKERYKVGLDAIATVYEAQAAFDSSRALLISAKNNLNNQYENLSLITNTLYQNIATLKSNELPLIKPNPPQISAWTDIASKQNLLLKASQYAVYSAKQNINAYQAGHLPTLSLSGNYTHTNNNSPIAFLRTKKSTKVALLTLNIPLYSGGLVLSQTKQATYDYETARDALEITTRSTLVNTRISYNTIIDGISTIKADKQAVKSAANSLKSISAQFKAGTRTMVDVVTYQKNLFQSQMQLASDQYSYILGLLQLKYLAGTLTLSDLEKINLWLTHK